MLRGKLYGAGLTICLVAFGVVVVGQQPQSSTQTPTAGVQQPRQARAGQNGMRRPVVPLLFRVLRRLNLTDAQRQQVRSIVKTSLQSNQPQRQELRRLAQQWRRGTLTPEGLARANDLRKQLGENRRATRAQLIVLLTPEQKTNLQRFEDVLKARRANQKARRAGQTPG